jgi:predicted Zn-dependent protease
MEDKRRGQLSSYIDGIAKGLSPAAAATAAFGDIKQLERELDAYRTKPLLQFKIGAAKIQPGEIKVQPLSQGAAQVILTRGRLKFGDDRKSAEQYLQGIRDIGTRFPGEELVETTLAEAELLAEHPDAAEAAADRALKANQRNTEAMVLKGRAIAEWGLKEDDESKRHQLFEQARKIFIAANKVDSEDPEPLYEYYRAHLTEGMRPTANAIAALHYASDLVPQDFGLRMNSAIAYLNANQAKEARATLIAVAYSPHSSSAGEAARRMIARIDADDAKGAVQAAYGGAGDR